MLVSPCILYHIFTTSSVLLAISDYYMSSAYKLLTLQQKLTLLSFCVCQRYSIFSKANILSLNRILCIPHFPYYYISYCVTLLSNSITLHNDVGSCHILANYGLTFLCYCITNFCNTSYHT